MFTRISLIIKLIEKNEISIFKNSENPCDNIKAVLHPTKIVYKSKGLSLVVNQALEEITNLPTINQ